MGLDGTPMGWAMRTRFGAALCRTAGNRTLLDRLAAALIVAVVALVAVYTWVKPDYNWDMVAYVATALEDRISDPVALHAETWKEIGKGASEGDLQRLQYGEEYNRHQWENPVDFQSQLTMYRVKVGYIALLRGLGPLVGLDKAAILLSILPSIAFGGLCLFWLARENALQGAFVLVPMLIVAGYFPMTTAATPDMLAAVLAVAALYLLTLKRDVLACALLLAALAVRPDTLILILALMIAAVAFGWRKTPFIVTFGLGLAASIAIERSSGHPGWWSHFYFSNVHFQNSMANFNPDFSLAAFAKGYLRGATVGLMENLWPALLGLYAVAWALLSRAGKILGRRQHGLMFALMIGTLGKFASFPLPDDRFYFVFTAGLATLITVMWKPRFDTAVVSAPQAA